MVPEPLLGGVLCHRIPPEGAVTVHHPEGGPSTAGDAAEALAAKETVHLHLVEAHGALRFTTPGPLQDGLVWWVRKHKSSTMFVSVREVTI